MKVKLYVEGGGRRASLNSNVRKAFNNLLKRAGFEGRTPKAMPCGSRNDAFDDFAAALNSRDEYYPMLLVDSESAVSSEGAWEHLNKQDGWSRPDGVADDQAQLMVQCMETWCVADREALKKFFGQCLRTKALPKAIDLEKCSKEDVQKKLSHATRDCGRDKKYQKGKRSFELLATLDPDVLIAKLPHFKRLCDCLSEKLSATGG